MKDNKFLIAIGIGIIILAIASRGEIFRSNPSFVLETSGSGSSRSSQTQNDTTREINSISRQISDLSLEVQKYIDNQNASAYRDKIIISDVRNPGRFFEYITLRSSIGSGEQVNITGWRLRSAVTGNEFVIGNGSNIARVSGTGTEPIIMSRGDRAILITDRSPLGSSFRINKCIGYLAQNINFIPNISVSCPAISDFSPPLSNNINNFCLDFIERLPSCITPRDRDLPDELSSECKRFIETNSNYNSCVGRHINDTDFLRSEWRVYSGRAMTLWINQRDQIILLDNFGRVVDTYET